MKSMLRYFLVLLTASILLNSCSNEGSTRRLPRFSGEPGEVLVIMPEAQWTGDAGDSLRVVLEKQYPALPQIEPSFKVLHFSPSEMSNMLKVHRNILRVVIGSEAEGKTGIEFKRNKWAHGQLYFEVFAANDAAFDSLLQNDFNKVTALINQTELNRIQDRYRAHGNDTLADRLEKKFGFRLALPPDCEVAVENENFVWLKRERVKYLGNTPHDITQGFFIFKYPYTSDSALTAHEALTTRDTVLEKYVPGPRKGSFMTTEYRLPPVTEVINLNDRYTLFTRGLWKMENYFMGGPFEAITTTSNDGTQIISVSGFVFAPRFDKREYIREVEAVIKSIRFSKKPD